MNTQRLSAVPPTVRFVLPAGGVVSVHVFPYISRSIITILLHDTIDIFLCDTTGKCGSRISFLPISESYIDFWQNSLEEETGVQEDLYLRRTTYTQNVDTQPSSKWDSISAVHYNCDRRREISIYTYLVGTEVLTTVIMGVLYLLAAWFMLVSCLAYSRTLKMEATFSSEKSVDFQRTELVIPVFIS
jgi:hypothetical protein